MLVTTVAAAAVAGCGGMPGGMHRMHAPQPGRVEGSLSEMRVGDFYRAN